MQGVSIPDMEQITKADRLRESHHLHKSKSHATLRRLSSAVLRTKKVK